MLALTPVVLQLVEAGITILPSIITAAKTEVSLFNSQTAPTPAQQAEIDDALAAAHAALQASVAAA
jgi:hypothetical protein